MGNYKYYENDFDSFDIMHEEGEIKTYIATSGSAEKADFLTKASNYFNQHDQGEKTDQVQRNKAVLIKRDAINSDNESVTVWRFVLKSGNGETIGHGEHYTRKESAVKTLENNFPNFQIVEITDLQDKDGTI